MTVMCPTKYRTNHERLSHITPKQWKAKLDRFPECPERHVVSRIIWWDYAIFHPEYIPDTDPLVASHYAYRIIDRLPNRERVIKYLIRLGYTPHEAEQRTAGSHNCFTELPKDHEKAKDVYRTKLNQLLGKVATKNNTTTQQQEVQREEAGSDGCSVGTEGECCGDEEGCSGVGAVRCEGKRGLRSEEGGTEGTHPEVAGCGTGGCQGSGETAEGRGACPSLGSSGRVIGKPTRTNTGVDL